MSRWITVISVTTLLVFSTILTFAQEANAQVIDMANTLNVRQSPTGASAVVATLPGETPLIVTGRSSTNRWYQLQTVDGSVSGWGASGFIDLFVSQASLPIVGASGTTSTTTTTSETTTAPAGPSTGTGSVNVSALNVRTASNTSGAIITEVTLGTVVEILGRNNTSTWLQVQLPDGTIGWVSRRYIDTSVAISNVPVSNTTVTVTTSTQTDDTGTPANVTVNVPAGDAPYFTLGASASNIFATGQQLGNRANVFSKIGDSMTVSEEMYRPFGFGQYNLGSYSYMSSTIDFFMAQARNNNSFNNTSLAAGNGWTTNTVQNSRFADSSICEPNESPLACEYRLTRPAVALIMLGSNDMVLVPIDEFANNMRTIADYSIANGVIPVLSTIPPRPDYAGRAEAYNRVIVQIAAERGLPLWDFYAAMVTLPNSGLNDDNLHPSSPPLGFANAANFTGEYLQYGYVMRNLTALQALHALRVNVLQ